MYKLYESKKKIPWITPNMENVPHWNISDDFFEFELVPNHAFNFQTWKTGLINSPSKDITYYKLINSITNEISYWYVSGIERVLKEGYTFKVEIDTFMTYGRSFFKQIIEKGDSPIIERCTLTSKMVKNRSDFRNVFYYLCNGEDDLLENADFIPSRYVNLEMGKPFKYSYVDNGNTNYVLEYSPSTSSNNFTWNLGLYIVIMKEDGNYHLHPICDYIWFLGWLKISSSGGHPDLPSSYIDSNVYINNKYSTIMKYVVNRKKPKYSEEIADYKYDYRWIGVDGIRDIETYYKDKSFIGIFKGPQLMIDEKLENHKFITEDLKQTNRIFYRLHNPQQPIKVKLPKHFNISNDLVKTYIELSQPIMWGTNEILPRKYISQARYGDNFYITFNISFINGFVGIPENTPFMTEDHMIGFGGVLPSASTEFTESMRKIKETFDTGLSNAIFGVIQGIPSAVGKAAASQTWGLSSTIGSSLTWSRDLYNLRINKKYAERRPNMSYINSTTSDWYYILSLFSNFKNSSALNTNNRDKQVVDIAIQKQFDDSQKTQLEFILNYYGFKVNTSMYIKGMVELLEPEQKFLYFKFNDIWLSNRIQDYISAPLDILNNVIDFLSNGIRINMEMK